MLESVYLQELLVGARRGRQSGWYRWLYGAVLAATVFFLTLYSLMPTPFWAVPPPDHERFHGLAANFTSVYISLHFHLLVLIVPAMCAGAITDEKVRGTLQYLLTADVSAWEIVLGKLFARATQIGILLLAGMPALAFFGTLAGLTIPLHFAFWWLTLWMIFGIGAAAILASVWCRQTREAVLVLYGVGIVVYALVQSAQQMPGAGIAFALDVLDPRHVLEAALSADVHGEFGKRLVSATVLWMLAALVCTLIAGWRLRPAYLKQLESSGRKPRWWHRRTVVERPPVSNHPIVWKEHHIEGIAPTAFFRRCPRWVGLALTFGISAWVSYFATPFDKLCLDGWVEFMGDWFTRMDASSKRFWENSLAAALLASFLVGIRCSGTITGEREKQTWEPLLLSPLDTKYLVSDKLWGVLWALNAYLLAYMIPALLFALIAGPNSVASVMIAYGWAWLSCYFVGAAGILCSAKSRSSWTSLFLTMIAGYVFGGMLFLPIAFVGIIIAMVIALSLIVLDQWLFEGSIGLSGANFDIIFSTTTWTMLIGALLVYWITAKMMFRSAIEHVSQRERLRHWGRPDPWRLFNRNRGRKQRERQVMDVVPVVEAVEVVEGTETPTITESGQRLPDVPDSASSS